MRTQLTPAEALPADAERATLIGRAWLPDAAGPSPVVVRGDAVYDLSRVAATCSGLLALDDPLAAVRAGDLPRIGSVADLLENSAHDRRDRRCAVADRALRSPGGQGQRRDVRGQPARARHRRAGARRRGQGPRACGGRSCR